MDLRIVANYPATDGSMPESVEIELTGIQADAAGLTMLYTASLPVLHRLLIAPAQRNSVVTQADFDRLSAEVMKDRQQ